MDICLHKNLQFYPCLRNLLEDGTKLLWMFAVSSWKGTFSTMNLQGFFGQIPVNPSPFPLYCFSNKHVAGKGSSYMFEENKIQHLSQENIC